MFSPHAVEIVHVASSRDDAGVFNGSLVFYVVIFHHESNRGHDMKICTRDERPETLSEREGAGKIDCARAPCDT